METRLADQAQHNGRGKAEAGLVDGPGAGARDPVRGLLGDAYSAIRRRVSKRLRADLHDRDPDYLRETLPLFWLFSTFYFRSDVRNLGNIPEEGPALLVGNHSGGNVIVDTFVFSLAFTTHFGVERRFHQLAHNLAIAWPIACDMLRQSGTISASQENAARALKS